MIRKLKKKLIKLIKKNSYKNQIQVSLIMIKLKAKQKML